ncbi:MAG: IclR family transcriptional regulator [Nocardioidaceae bacterium]
MDTGTVLGKVLAVLDAFTAEDRELSLAQLTGRTGLAKPTVHRIAGDLVASQWLERTPGGYRLGTGLFDLGMRATAQRSLIEVATPFMQDVYERTKQVVNLGVPDGDQVAYVAKIGGHRQVPLPTRLGGRMPLYCTGLGKALLAYAGDEAIARILAGPLARRTPHTVVAPGRLRKQLEQVVSTGVAYEHEESVAGVACVAAPILDPSEHAVAAISATGPSTSFRPERHAALLRAAAGGIALTYARRQNVSQSVSS